MDGFIAHLIEHRTVYAKAMGWIPVNRLMPNSDLNQTSHCSIKGLSVSEVMRIDKMITQIVLIF